MALPVYNYNNFEGRETISVLVQGEQLIADDSHPRFAEIVNKLIVEKDDTQDWVALFAPAVAIRTEFEKLSTEVSIRGGTIFYEGEALHGALADKIVSIYEAGENYVPFVLFLEKLKQNPEQHSVDNLYRWLLADPQGFTIADDGDLIVYKGVASDYKSHHSGNAIRNGEQLVNSRIPNVVGDVIEMDRKDVEHDPSNPCSTGLHVGTWEFVRGYSVIYKIKLHPKYVVSVPTDCGGQKMRVCRYQILEQITERVETEYERGHVEPESETGSDLEDAFQVHNIGGSVTQRPESGVGTEPDVLSIIRDPQGTLGWVDRVAAAEAEAYPAVPVPGGDSIQHETTQMIRLTNTGVRDTRLNYRSQRRGPDGRFLPKETAPVW